MADTPIRHPSGKPPRFNETAIAITVALIFSLAASWIFFDSPLHAMRLAYIDYSHTPADGARDASDVVAPLTEPEVKAIQQGQKPSDMR